MTHSTTKIVNVILIILILMYLIIPMTSFDTAAAFYHDSRWWLNQYFEFKQSFPNITKVSFSAFNNSGLSINTFYPTNTLRVLETPLILLNVSNPYFVIGYLNILSIGFVIATIYLITNVITKCNANKLFITLLFTTIYLLPELDGPVNSITQQLATSFMFLGIYALLVKKYKYIAVSTLLLLNTSISSSIIAAIAFLIVMILLRPTKKEYSLIILYGLMGLAISTPVLIPIIKNLHTIQPPTNLFSAKDQPLLVIGYFFGSKQAMYLGLIQSLRLVSISLIIYLMIKNHTHKLITKFILPITLIIITGLPRLSAYLTTPIQQGTWSRFWPVTTILILLLIKNTFVAENIKKYKNIIHCIAIINMVIVLINLPFTPASNQTKLFNHNLRTKKWKDLYSEIQTSSNNILEKKSQYTKVLRHTAILSPDYIPINASLTENQYAYNPPYIWMTKYGLEKHSINNGKTLKITINPKNKVTPLGVWHYDFIKYKVKSTHGHVVITKHDMFEYHGTKKTTIFITTK